ncbi:bifunctional 2-polyprenyl-6-hydroxyphenol methylase/3-demethylubiquinol 3-O-methyltransferase UbiG [Nocardiopsis sp. MG754419]|uniref:class I SAM-dependent methyltransferase n=1 Tax=Nocardiopsis sp. MG754419 TaxID=2259865 RepID=UPI001BAE35A9|nr:class I SAM-dependent methyltransferase [Nocardiopsis sp. MG754419]MBR8743091.1 class I SAM-dependent methyltransferase [Nocardiopsis sp. MG754419]
MAQEFDREFWEERYRTGRHDHGGHGPDGPGEPNPQLVAAARDLRPGRALEAGAGLGVDSLWLAGQGWRVTALDVSQNALDRAVESAERIDPEAAARIDWVRGDATELDPDRVVFDLVTSHYAHPVGPFSALVERLAAVVAVGGTLLIVGHDPSDAHGHAPHAGHAAAHVSAPEMADVLDRKRWRVLVAQTRPRTRRGGDGGRVAMNDAVMVARRVG